MGPVGTGEKSKEEGNDTDGGDRRMWDRPSGVGRHKNQLRRHADPARL